MPVDLSKFVSRKLAVLLLGLVFVSQIEGVEGTYKVIASAGLVALYIVAQAVQNIFITVCLRKEPANGNGQGAGGQ